MEAIQVFETTILSHISSIDNQKLILECHRHQSLEPSMKFSNSGYQGHNFASKELFDLIHSTIPKRGDMMLQNYEIQAWVNINDGFDWNDIHNHQDDGVLLSGVYYVRVPENSGNIRFYDPRHSTKTLYDQYYNYGKGNYLSVTPQEGMILYFPPALNHMVEPNLSGRERISIAFNIVNPVW